MSTTDLINSTIEFANIFLMCLNIRRIHLDKQVKGISIYSALYSWGYSIWFAYFCLALDQPISFVFSSIYVLVNLTWLIMFIYYNFYYKEK